MTNGLSDVDEMNASDAFRDGLVMLIPQMRGFARSLCNDPAAADDLVQESLAKALAARAGFTRGDNLRAWLFTIARNQFYSQQRRAWRLSPLDPAEAELRLVEDSAAPATVELDELRRALARLPLENREALILVAAAGMTYDEAGEICGVPAGTVKSRVSRARNMLARIYTAGDLPTDNVPASEALAYIISQVEAIKTSRGLG